MIEKKTVSMCSTSEYCRGWNDAVDEYNLRPIPKDDILDTFILTPCWIEVRREYSDESEFIADVLDKDSVAYFGMLDSKKRDKTRYFYPGDYNRTWRCWRAFVSLSVSNNVKWEADHEDH